MNTLTMTKINDVACNPYGIIQIKLSIFVLSFLMLLICHDSLGDEPDRVKAYSNVSARIVTADQMAEIGIGDTAYIRSDSRYSTLITDTMLTAGKYNFLTLNCE